MQPLLLLLLLLPETVSSPKLLSLPVEAVSPLSVVSLPAEPDSPAEDELSVPEPEAGSEEVFSVEEELSELEDEIAADDELSELSLLVEEVAGLLVSELPVFPGEPEVPLFEVEVPVEELLPPPVVELSVLVVPVEPVEGPVLVESGLDDPELLVPEAPLLAFSELVVLLSVTELPSSVLPSAAAVAGPSKMISDIRIAVKARKRLCLIFVVIIVHLLSRHIHKVKAADYLPAPPA